MKVRPVLDVPTTGDALLLFDEAEAILERRDEVKNRNNRYANLEVSYLLSADRGPSRLAARR